MRSFFLSLRIRLGGSRPVHVCHLQPCAIAYVCPFPVFFLAEEKSFTFAQMLNKVDVRSPGICTKSFPSCFFSYLCPSPTRSRAIYASGLEVCSARARKNLHIIVCILISRSLLLVLSAGALLIGFDTLSLVFSFCMEMGYGMGVENGLVGGIAWVWRGSMLCGI